MALSLATDLDLGVSGDAARVRRLLSRARGAYYEDPAGALTTAIRCYEAASSLREEALCARARAVQGMVSLHRGDLRGGLALAVEAERHAESCDDAAADAEVAAMKSQLSFFTGSYADALRLA